jgi:hypothetical protein
MQIFVDGWLAQARRFHRIAFIELLGIKPAAHHSSVAAYFDHCEHC